MENLILAMLLLASCSLDGQISAINLYSSGEQADQRSYGNGAIAMLIKDQHLDLCSF